MTSQKIIICVIIICIIFGFINYKQNETFNDNPTIFSVPTDINLEPNTKLSGLKLNFKKNRPYNEEQKYNKHFDDIKVNKPPNITYEDDIFANIITYENDIYLDGKLGLEKCIEQCNGECLEFGQTGIAHCFPNDDKGIMKSSYYENLRDISYKTDMVGEKQDKLIYANLR